MNGKLTRDAVNAIVEAYRNHLYVEWEHNGDWLHYSIQPSMFSILRKESCTEYKKIVGYNIKDVLTNVEGDFLKIVTMDNMIFMFMAEDEE